MIMAASIRERISGDILVSPFELNHQGTRQGRMPELFNCSFPLFPFAKVALCDPEDQGGGDPDCLDNANRRYCGLFGPVTAGSTSALSVGLWRGGIGIAALYLGPVPFRLSLCRFVLWRSGLESAVRFGKTQLLGTPPLCRIVSLSVNRP